MRESMQVTTARPFTALPWRPVSLNSGLEPAIGLEHVVEHRSPFLVQAGGALRTRAGTIPPVPCASIGMWQGLTDSPDRVGGVGLRHRVRLGAGANGAQSPLIFAAELTTAIGRAYNAGEYRRPRRQLRRRAHPESGTGLPDHQHQDHDEQQVQERRREPERLAPALHLGRPAAAGRAVRPAGGGRPRPARPRGPASGGRSGTGRRGTPRCRRCRGRSRARSRSARTSTPRRSSTRGRSPRMKTA